MSAVLPCAFCGVAVRLDLPHYERVRGWERKRAAGGANQITLREVDSTRVACDGCIRRKRLGVPDGQGALL